MPSPTLVSRAAALLTISLFVSDASAQAVAGAKYFAGGGAPGAASYQLIDDYQPAVFFSKFAFYDSYDPTYGHVQYVNESVAETNGYVQVTSRNTALIKPDTTNLWPRGGKGRPSVRITSKNTYLHGLFILDLTHMPWGCGTWPAYWLLGPNWPYTGEIDVIEGVNTSENNTLSLHTNPGCTIAGSGQTGDFKTNNCDVYENDNAGCGTLLDTSNPNNYGSNFNGNGGGVYVTEWTSEYIQHWFFPRGSIPSSITSGTPDVSQFGTPAVNAQGSCDFDSHFQNMSVIFNIDFCGAWAGNVYRNFPQCPQNPDSSVSALDSCVDFVGNNPSQLSEAYFDISSLRVYQMPNAIQPTSTYSTSFSSVTTGIASTNTISLGQGAPTTGASYSSLVYTGPLSSSSLVSSLAASSVPVATNTPQETPLSASSASCPSADSKNVVDSCGIVYTIRCNSDTTGGSPGPVSVDTFNDCFEACSSGLSGTCSAFTFVKSTKNCYLKNAANEQFTGGSADTIGAIMLEFYGADTPTPVSTQRVCTTGLTSSDVISSTSAASTTSSFAVADSSSTMDLLATSVDSSTSIIPASSGSPEMIGSTTSLSIRDGITSTTIILISSSLLASSWTTSLVISNGEISTIPLSSTSTWQAMSSSFTPSQPVSITLVVSNGASSTSMVATASSFASPSRSILLSVSDGFESNVSPSTTASSTSTPQPPSCPTGSSSDVCGTSSEMPICLSSGGSAYALSCGKIWTGTAISDDLVSMASVKKRVIAPDFASCQATCDANLACVAVNYIGTNCTLFSQVTGQQPYPGAVTAAQVPIDEPSCPDSARSTYTDANGSAYRLGCYTSFAGNVIGSSIFEAVFTDCLPYCDALSGCVGVEYDMFQNLCYLKSSFTGLQTSDTGRIVARRNAVSPGTYVTTTQQVTVTPGSLTTTLFVSPGLAVTEAPTTIVIETLPPGGSFTVVSSASSTGSFYVYTSSGAPNDNPGGGASLCRTCGILPTVVTGPDTQPSVIPTGGRKIITVTRTTHGSTCPTTHPGPGTTTLLTTQTITSCGPQPVCPNPGWIIIGGSTAWSGAVTITTTNSNGNIITYTQIPNTATTQKGTATMSAGIPTGSASSTDLPTCPYAQGTIYTDYMGMQWQILCDSRFADTTLSTVTAARLVDCIASCDMYNLRNMYASNQCSGVSWTAGTKKNNCAIKDGSTAVMRIGTHSARLLTMATVPGNSTVPGGGGTNTIGIGSMSPVLTGSSGTVVSGGGGRTTILSTYATASGLSTFIATRTIVSGGQTVVSTAYATATEESAADGGSGPGAGGSGGGRGGMGSSPGMTAYVLSTVFGVSTAYSISVSNGITYTNTYGVTTVLTVSYIPASTRTVTTTTVSISISNIVSTAVSTYYQYSTIVSNGVTTVVSSQVSTAYVVSTAAGGTVTQNGATVTQAGPTVTASAGSGAVTVFTGGGTGGGGSGGIVTVTAPPVTRTTYVVPSSSNSVSYCRTTATNYLNGALPAKIRKRSVFDEVGRVERGARPFV